MKKLIYLFAVCMMSMVVASCGGKSNSSDAVRIAQLEDSIRHLQSKKTNVDVNTNSENFSTQNIEETETFETSKGTFTVESTTKLMYNLGVNDGEMERKLPNNRYNAQGTWEDGKHKFINVRGLPKGEKGKEIMDKAIKSYMQGYKDALNF